MNYSQAMFDFGSNLQSGAKARGILEEYYQRGREARNRGEDRKKSKAQLGKLDDKEYLNLLNRGLRAAGLDTVEKIPKPKYDKDGFVTPSSQLEMDAFTKAASVAGMPAPYEGIRISQAQKYASSAPQPVIDPLTGEETIASKSQRQKYLALASQYGVENPYAGFELSQSAKLAQQAEDERKLQEEYTFTQDPTIAQKLIDLRSKRAGQESPTAFPINTGKQLGTVGASAQNLAEYNRQRMENNAKLQRLGFGELVDSGASWQSSAPGQAGPYMNALMTTMQTGVPPQFGIPGATVGSGTRSVLSIGGGVARAPSIGRRVASAPSIGGGVARAPSPSWM